MQESETDYKQLAELSPDGMAIHVDEKLVFINPAGARLLGATEAKELLGKPIFDFVHSDHRPIVRARLQALKQDEQAHWIEERLIRLDGTEVEMEVADIPFTYEGKPAVQTVFRNISGHRRAQEVLQQRNRELALLNRASQVFISTLDLDQVLTTVLEEVRHLLDVVVCSVWLVDLDTNELVCRQVADPQSEGVRGWRLALGQGLAGWVARHGQSLNVPDAQADKRHFRGIQQTGLEMRSILSIPLRVKEEVVGVLQVVDTKVNRFSTTDLTLLESLAATAAIAIENARLYEQARRDAETKSILLREVNHRVKNNLATIIGLLYAERRHAKIENRSTYQTTMKDLINRVQGLAAVHDLLSASQWSPLSLSKLTSRIIYAALQGLPYDKRMSVEVSPSPVRVTPKQANSLALVINELATNTVKYALSTGDTGQITVRITDDDEGTSPPQGGESIIIFEFRDDGPGYPEKVLQLERYNVGLYLIQAIVRGDLHGELMLHNDHGAVTRIRFKPIAE